MNRLLDSERIDALASSAQRWRVVESLMAGRIVEFLEWRLGPGRGPDEGPPAGETDDVRIAALFRPLPVDQQLFLQLAQCGDAAQAQRLRQVAFKRVRLLMASPLEMLLREGTVGALDHALSLCSSPRGRFEGVVPLRRCAGWTTLFARLSAEPSTAATRNLPAWASQHSLLTLALLQGRVDRAQALARHGLSPTDPFGWSDLFKAQLAVRGLGVEWLTECTGIAPSDGEMAGEWLWMQERLCLQLRDAVEREARGPWARRAVQRRHKVDVAMACSSAVDASSLARLAVDGDITLLRRLFACGANPNALMLSGHPALCHVNRHELAEDMLQVWLDAGFNPAGGMQALRNGSLMNLLVADGNLRLLRQCCELAVRPVSLSCRGPGGCIVTPLLAMALELGQAHIARWMVDEQGCPLSSGMPLAVRAAGY